ncbi:MAG TPA: hypothetical protein PLZ58_00825 [Candidatus Saccharibacteria bacterium]|nr:hypothetical protein [Candidatus Saccharibacteria bacterium]HRQ07135.1 hypothetical protein [Candidatus Saccharibacteria bacterium]
MNPSDKNLLKRSAYELADSIATSIPGVAQAWALGKALYGNALELRQQRALEWVEAIQNDQSAFNEQVVNSEEFQDGFIAGLEDYIKLRSYLKRRTALKVFKEFASTADKIEFPLERYNDTLKKISPASIRTLAFIKHEILPIMERRLEVYNGGEPGIKMPTNPHAFSTYDETGKLKSMTDQLAELEYLGLIRQVSSYPSGLAFSSSGMISGWAFTNFAEEFIRFIEEDTQLEDNSLMH